MHGIVLVGGIFLSTLYAYLRRDYTMFCFFLGAWKEYSDGRLDLKHNTKIYF